jgi:hypothetical protein
VQGHQGATCVCEGVEGGVREGAAMKKLRIVTLRLARGDRKWPLNDGQVPHVRAVRAHVSTGYNRVEGNRRETAA